MRQTLLLLLLTVTAFSCDTTKNQIITKDNVESSVTKIKKDKDLDSTKIDLLDNLVALTKGREEYINMRLKDESKKAIEKYIVSKEKFDENVDALFSYFLANKVSYKMLLTEIDTLNLLKDKEDKELESVYNEIDRFCKGRQKEIEEKELKARVIKDSLNKMVDLKILSIKETEIDYHDVIQVAIQMINKTDKKIEAIGFNMELTDKLGTNLGTLRCKSNNGFLKSDIGHWVYDRWENDEIYKSLRNTDVSHVTTKQEVTRLNIAGELISAYGDLEDLAIDLKYKTPKKLKGYCSYLDDEDELSKKVDAVRDKTLKEIKVKLVSFTKYNEFNSKLLDFSQLLN
ncbi:hypothetical protein ACFQ21_13280 [Ohtaekwangia kribbensis]|uniref:Lipoprotein n=1 Tax=Ohtaekwangia kribbensis TaxID=688913 RepID=A0ABW3K2D7_9BACT